MLVHGLLPYFYRLARRASVMCVLLLGLSSLAASLRADQIDMSQYRGQVVAWLYWQSQCAHCSDVIRWAERLQQRRADEGLAVLAINTDPAPSYQDWDSLPHYQLDMIYDSDASLLDTYPVASVPSLLLFDRNGRLLSAYTQLDKQARVSIESHLDRVLTD